MTIEQFSPKVGVTASEAAVAHIRRQLSAHPENSGIRLAIKQSGCSGYMYDTEWVDTPADDDQTFEVAEGVRIYVRSKDLPIVNGTEVDFITQGLNSMFQFKNPNAKAECGCGESFTVN